MDGAANVVTDFSARWTQNEATSHTGNAPGSSHDFNSWKATAFYDAVDWLRFRATVSQDVRAAGFRELFLPRVDTIAAGFPAPVNNPWSGVQDVYLNISGGNPDLKPETADTKTLGMVLSFERFHFSIDRFEIDLKDAITPGGAGGIGAQQLVQACFASGGAGAVCDKIGGARGANNAIADITSVDTRSINIGKFLTKGYDLEATYNWSLRQGGDLQLRMIGTYLPDMIIDTGLGSPAVNYHGQSGPVASFGGFNTSPDWQARTFVTWVKDKLTTTFETRYISSGKLNATWTESPPGSPSNTTALTVNDNSVEDAYYLAWSGSWDFTKSSEGRGTQLFWAVNNLFDKDPPVAPGGNVYPTNPVFFDTLGLRYRVGVRFSF